MPSGDPDRDAAFGFDFSSGVFLASAASFTFEESRFGLIGFASASSEAVSFTSAVSLFRLIDVFVSVSSASGISFT